jgi:hypothetical protein
LIDLCAGHTKLHVCAGHTKLHGSIKP